MKHILLALLLLTGLSSFAQIERAKLQASGLTCSMCSKAVYQALKKVPFVETIKANISESSYTITFKKDAVVDFDALGKAVKDAGFSVAKLDLTANFNNVEVANDKHIQLDGKTFHFLNVNQQTLNGEKTITLVDKQFVTEKEHNRYSKFTTMKCFNTGKMDTCCEKNKAAGVTDRVYHVTINT